MAPFLPVRAISRSQKIRIGRASSSEVSVDTTFYVDLGDGNAKRDLQHHQAIGAVVVVGALTNSIADVVVVTGATFTAGAGLNNSTIAAGELRTRSTGAHVPIILNTAVTFTANASGNPRVDQVIVNNTTGVVSVTAGTAAVAPVAPATPGTSTPLYNVAIANAAAAPGAATDVRPRP